MGDELTLADRKAIASILEQKKEDSKWNGLVDCKEGGKKEKRILIISTNKIIFLKPGSGTKPLREHHYLDLEALSSSDKSELTMNLKGTNIVITSSASDDIIDAIRQATASSFPGVPEKDRFRLEVNPDSRLRELNVPDQPLAGFIATYKSMCVYYGTEPQQEVLSMEAFYLSGNIRSFNLQEYEQPMPPQDFRSLLGALQFNVHFKSLIIKDINLDKVMTEAVAKVLKFNTKLEEIYLSKCGLKADGIKEICDALTFNKALLLTTFDLSGNSLEDKGISFFASWLGGLNRGLAKLDLSGCGITGKGFREFLGPALKRNVHMSNTLTFFDLSDNKLEADGSQQLANFLASPNSTRFLNIAHTSANVDVILAAILRGSTEIRELNLAGNKINKKDSLVRFLQSAGSLTTINLSNTQPSPDMARDIINAIASNPYLKDVSLNISENKLGLEGARFIQSIAEKIGNISFLDLSENEFGDEGVQYVADGFCYNSTIKHLLLNGNFKGKHKNLKASLEAVITLLNSDCPIESLGIAGSKGSELKSSIKPIISAIAANTKLKSLDVSGHEMGNGGATALSRTLQMNNTLESLKWDNNSITYQGYEVFANGLRRNRSLKNMPLPIFDIGNAIKDNSKTLKVIERIEQLLLRNQDPESKFQTEEVTFEGGPSNQFAFLASGQRELLQKALLKIKSTGKKVEAENQVVVEDAENTDQYMTNLFSLKDEVYTKLEHDMKDKLTSNAKTIIPIYGGIKAELVKMVDAQVRKSYKCLDEDTVKRLQTVLAFGAKDLEQEEIERVLIESAGAQLIAKANQALHNLVSLASDYIYEKVGDQLNFIADELIEESEESLSKMQRSGSSHMVRLEESAKIKEEKKPEEKKPPSKPAPPPPDKKPTSEAKQETKPESKPSQEKKPPSKPVPPPKPASNRPSKPTEEENVLKDLPQVKTLTEHATKDRPAAKAGRRPPTRKAHNAQAPTQM